MLTEQVLVRRAEVELCGLMDRGMEGVELMDMDIVELYFWM